MRAFALLQDYSRKLTAELSASSSFNIHTTPFMELYRLETNFKKYFFKYVRYSCFLFCLCSLYFLFLFIIFICDVSLFHLSS